MRKLRSGRRSWAAACLAAAGLVLASALPAAADQFGYNSVYTSSLSSVRYIQIGTQVTLPVAGQVTSVTVYIGNSTSSFRCAIYTDSGGEPGSLVAQTGTQTSTSSMAWRTATFSSPPTLAAGTYWLAVALNSNYQTLRYTTSTGKVRHKSNNAVSYGYLSSWGSSNSSYTRRMSIYATYTPLTAKTYYVRTTGSDSNTGLSASLAWRTIGKAAQSMFPSDKVYVGAGTYNEKVAPTNSGTSGSPISFIADSDGENTGDSGTVTITRSNDKAIDVNGKNYIRFEGFTVVGTGTSANAIEWQNAVGGELSACDVTKAGGYALYIASATLTIDTCIIHDGTSDGINIDINSNVTISECDILRNSGEGIDADNTGTTLSISRTKVESNGSHGLLLNNVTATIINCLADSNSGDGLQNGAATGNNVTVWNSTFASNTSDGLEHNGGTVNARNSIFAFNVDDGLDRNGGTLTHTYNLIYGNGDQNFEGTSQSTGEKVGDPLFGGGGDYHVQTGSPGVNFGTNASGIADEDLEGNSRPIGSAWDMGCYEGTVTPPNYTSLVDGYSSNGPIAWWRLNENTGATTAVDEIGDYPGTYVNGTLAGQAGIPLVPSNKAASVDGVNDYINVGNVDLSGGAMTILAWFKPDDFDFDTGRIISKATSNSTESAHYWMLSTVNSSGSYRLRARLKTGGTTSTLIATNGNLTAGVWTFAAMVYNGSYLILYKDGEEVGRMAKTGSITSASSVAAWIGDNAPSGGSNPFDGTIDEVAIYDKALNAQQIAAIYSVSLTGIYSGLVGHWKFDETSGTIAYDYSGKANRGTVSGATWTASGKTGGALSFNGTSDYVSVPNASNLQLTSQLSITAWVKGSSWGSGSFANAIVRKGEDNPNNYQLAIADGHLALMLDEFDAAGFRGNTALQAGKWYHVAATWDGSQVNVYLNGAPDRSPAYSKTGPIGTDTRTLYLGGRPGTDSFHGILDDVRIYNRALTADEVTQVMQAGGGMPGVRILTWQEVK